MTKNTQSKEETKDTEQQEQTPSKILHMIDIMASRGFTLSSGSQYEPVLVFGNYRHKDPRMHMTVYWEAKENTYQFTSFVYGGAIRLTSDIFSCLEDEKTFNEVLAFFFKCLKKLK